MLEHIQPPKEVYPSFSEQNESRLDKRGGGKREREGGTNEKKT